MTCTVDYRMTSYDSVLKSPARRADLKRFNTKLANKSSRPLCRDVVQHLLLSRLTNNSEYRMPCYKRVVIRNSLGVYIPTDNGYSYSANEQQV